jgi:glycosyltransferase involved in cell wall biosynthesis
VRGVPSAYGGFETFLTELLPILAARGHHIEVFNRADEGIREYRGVTLRHVGPPVGGAFETVAHGLRVAPQIDKRLFDVVLAFNIANVPALAMLRAQGIPTVLNTDGQEWERGKWGRAARAYWRLCARGARLSATAVICDSLTMQQIYLSRFKVTSTLIPYCVRNDGAAIPRLTSFPFDEPYFLAAGRVVPENQLSYIAQAHSSHSSHSHQRRLVVLGKITEGEPESDRLVKIAGASGGRVLLGGHLSSPAHFLSVAQNADLYIHGHTVGGINPALVDAMSAGAHIAAYDTPFNREALGARGQYWSTGGALASLMNDLLADQASQDGQDTQDSQDGVRDSRVHARSRAESTFGAEEVADAYESLRCERPER